MQSSAPRGVLAGALLLAAPRAGAQGDVQPQAQRAFQAAAGLLGQGRLEEAAALSAEALRLQPASASVLNLEAYCIVRRSP